MPRAVILGGYGLIGSACAKALADAGFAVTGVGRSARRAQGGDPRIRWVIGDVTRMGVDEIRAFLAGADVVVNAAGALQDGAGDDLTAIHVTLIEKLLQALQDLPCRLIQISAAGVSPTASTHFFRTKAAGDALIVGSALDWVILRPVLVLSPRAYGGTALLRAAAALPLVMPLVFPKSKVQTVHVDDVAKAVLRAAQRKLPSGLVADLTESGMQDMASLLGALRRWLGLPDARFQLPLPGALVRLTGRLADGLGMLGWRSPLRTTALRALADGIEGDAGPWLRTGGAPCRSLAQSLLDIPATEQERQFARSYFALPFAIGTLSLFWLASGLIALADPAAAQAVLTERGMSAPLAMGAVLVGAVADLGLGLAVLWRQCTQRAALGMVGLSFAYLGASLFTAPDLWLDPLGPMVKVLPGMALALWVWLLVDRR